MLKDRARAGGRQGLEEGARGSLFGVMNMFGTQTELEAA